MWDEGGEKRNEEREASEHQEEDSLHHEEVGSQHHEEEDRLHHEEVGSLQHEEVGSLQHEEVGSQQHEEVGSLRIASAHCRWGPKVDVASQVEVLCSRFQRVEACWGEAQLQARDCLV